MKKYHVSDLNKMTIYLTECTNITEAIYLYFGTVAEVKAYFNRLDKLEYLGKIGLDYIALDKPISYYDVFCGKTSISHDLSPTEIKNFYHRVLNQFGWEAANLIKKQGFFGRAYYNALLHNTKGCKNCYLPPAKMIFEELSKLLTRATYHGFEVDESVKKYM